MEFCEAIAITNLEFKRLGWTIEEQRKFLKDNYNVKSRQLLSDEQLENLCNHLKTIK